MTDDTQYFIYTDDKNRFAKMPMERLLTNAKLYAKTLSHDNDDPLIAELIFALGAQLAKDNKVTEESFEAYCRLQGDYDLVEGREIT